MEDEKNKYLSVAVPGTNMFAQAKLTDEGIVLDLFEQKGDEVEVVKSTYKFFDEMGVEMRYVEEKEWMKMTN